MTHHPEIVVAYGRDGAIGQNNELPWRLPADLARFKALTTGKPVLMGRKTWDSLPERFRPLPNRHNIVLSLSQKAIEGAHDVVSSIDMAIERAQSPLMIIGGAQVYDLALPYVNTIHATEIEVEVRGADAHFPLGHLRDNDEWVEDTSKTEVHFPDDKNPFIYSFVTYTRRASIPLIEQ